MLRFFSLNAFIAIHTIILSIWAVLLAIFDRNGKLIHKYAAVPWAKVVLWICGVRLETKGLENIDPDQPRIYMSNHQSYFDIFALLAGLPADFKFILKQELMKIPFMGLAIKRAGYIGINRSDPKKALKSMAEAAEKIKKGNSVLIFPEGTRSENGIVQQFKKGGFHLAIKSGCDIIPVSINHSRDIVPKGSLRVKKGTIEINIGCLIPVKEYPKRNMDKLINDTRERIIEQMDLHPDKGESC